MKKTLYFSMFISIMFTALMSTSSSSSYERQDNAYYCRLLQQGQYAYAESKKALAYCESIGV